MTYPGSGGGPGWGPPTQQPWPPQPQQQFQPQQPYGGYPPQEQPRQPLTLPGWGAIPAILGTIAAVVGMFALSWASALPVGMLQLAELADMAGRYGAETTFAEDYAGVYLSWAAMGLVAGQALAVLLWTLGAVRSKTSARWILNTSGRSLAEGRLGPTRVLEGTVSVIVTGVHVASVFVVSQGEIGELGMGPWVLVGGSALLTVGAVIGPRLPPQYPAYPPQEPAYYYQPHSYG